ncbi:hypothetical protein HYC85_006559 [Camellia sinensis]|uniref:Uncharacterized protein n=1 Tax=Camellia sinensis TaxID=4442 RepID=A0A7J7HLF9_CAMSI|nr:hypothetical protein HYC85_006559 [Camellia sinensis]
MQTTPSSPLDEWQLKRFLTDFLKSFFSIIVPEDDIIVRRFKDLKKRKRDDPVVHDALFIHDLGFLSTFSRSEILHGIDGEDDVKELEKRFLDWRRLVVGKTDGIELSLEGVKFRLTASVPESNDFGMRKEWEELNAFGNRGLFLPDAIVLKGVPSRWFAEPRVSSKPSMLLAEAPKAQFSCDYSDYLALECYYDTIKITRITAQDQVVAEDSGTDIWHPRVSQCGQHSVLAASPKKLSNRQEAVAVVVALRLQDDVEDHPWKHQDPPCSQARLHLLQLGSQLTDIVVLDMMTLQALGLVIYDSCFQL